MQTSFRWTAVMPLYSTVLYPRFYDSRVSIQSTNPRPSVIERRRTPASRISLAHWTIHQSLSVFASADKRLEPN